MNSSWLGKHWQELGTVKPDGIPAWVGRVQSLTPLQEAVDTCELLGEGKAVLFKDIVAPEVTTL